VNRVKAGVFSFTPPLSSAEDDEYLRWHLLDHMPEQYQLPGMLHGVRWVGETGSVVNYLIGGPVQQTHDEFFALGRRLGEQGRFPYQRPSLELDFLALLRADAAPAALVSAEVVPFRPHRGVFLIVATADAGHCPEVLDAPGVAGVWTYGSTDAWTLNKRCQPQPRYITVVYIDGDVAATASALAPLVDRHWSSDSVIQPFTGAYRSMIRWDAWPD
jgi:hypothetical protein